MPTRGEDDYWQSFSWCFWVSPGLTRQHLSFPGIYLGGPRLHIVRHLFIPAHQAKMHPRARHPVGWHSRAMVPAATLGFEDVLSEVESLHCLIGWFWGPDHSVVGLQFKEIYALRDTSRTMRQLSDYDVPWLPARCWMCVCKGFSEHGSGCSMQWRRRGWVDLSGGVPFLVIS